MSLDLARDLLAAGIPVVVCTPHTHREGCRPGCDRELDQPTGWSTVTADRCDLSTFRPGVDVLAMVAGHGVDVVDIDSKAGGHPDLLPPFESFGVHRTPSGGWHVYVRSTGIGKLSPLIVAGKVIGDYCGGTRAGGARLLVYLPGSTRPKYPGKAYTVESPLDLDKLLDSEPDEDLVAMLIGAGGRDDTMPGAQAAAPAEVRAFLEQHLTRPERFCNYGRAAVAGMLADAEKAKDDHGGRHGWAVRSAARVVELIRGGCCWTGDVAELQKALDRIKPEGGTDLGLVLAWALTNATGTTACGVHGDHDDDQPEATDVPDDQPAEPVTLAQAHQVFHKWLGEDYDAQALDAVLGAATADRLDGDPPWLLVLSGSGNAKTETVGALAGAGAVVTSTLTSEGALLSATSRREKSKDATGGLLRKIGDTGVLVIKDVTSVLSMNRETRTGVLAALREVADGFWERNVGTDGGRTLTWSGRIVTVGAVTTAWDTAHSVIASMGDRFVLVRMDSTEGRVKAGRQALRNVGHETTMRAELAAAVAGLMAGVDPDRAVLGDDDVEVILALADVVTLGRTAVERDYQGNVIDAHAPEMPTRFAKMLGQIVRGCRALGMDQAESLAVAVRCAGDSMPPLRLAVLADVADHPGSRTSEVNKRLQKPRSTVDRVLQELHVLGLVEVEDEVTVNKWGDPKAVWRYSLAHRDGLEVIVRALFTRKVRKETHSDDVSGDVSFTPVPPCTDEPGEQSTGGQAAATSAEAAP